MSSVADLSGAAFGNVDAVDDMARVVTYLETAAAHFRALKRLSYRSLWLKPGAAVLDVGCGTGDDARELAKLVGARGRVVGVDASESLIAEARRRAEGAVPRLEFLVAEAHRIEFPADSFDACRADRVLQHLADPSAALAEMVRVCRPGGIVEIVDRDWGLVAVDADDQVVTRIILDRICGGIRNGWIGRRLPALFHDAGLEHVRATARPIALREFQAADALLDLTIVTGHAVNEALVSEGRATVWLQELQARSRTGRFFAMLMMFIVTGRKPQKAMRRRTSREQRR